MAEDSRNLFDAPANPGKPASLALFDDPNAAPATADVLEPAKPPEWKDLPGNILPSAADAAKNLVQPFLHPVQTAHGLYNLATDADTRSQVGQFYKDRYGGINNLHDTLIKDPVGVAADLASVLTGGEWALAKAATKGGTLANVATKIGQAGRAIDPVTNAAKIVGGTAKAAGNLTAGVLGKTTLAGTDAIKDAARSGFDGSKTFLENLQGKVPTTAVLDDVTDGINQMKQQMQQEYQQKFPRITQEMNTQGIHDAFADIMKSGDPVTDMKTPRGLDKGEVTGQQLSGIKDLIDKYTTEKKWELVPIPNDPYGIGRWEEVTHAAPRGVFELDGLKQSLNEIYGSVTPKAQRVIQTIKQQISDTIDGVAPGYSTEMDKYHDATQVLTDIRQTLSQGTKAGNDTKLMKLGRIYNDTPTGVRSGKLIDQIEDTSGKPIRAALAGQRMSNWLPGGGKLFPMMAEGAAGVGIAKVAGLSKAAVLAPAFSPRIVGGAAYRAGRAAGLVGEGWNKAHLPSPRVLGRTSYQVGRLTSDAMGNPPDTEEQEPDEQ